MPWVSAAATTVAIHRKKGEPALGIVYDIILEQGGTDVRDLESVREAALDHATAAAENRNVYYRDAWENVWAYAEYEPCPEELAAYLPPEQRADWRAVLLLAAIGATRGHLEAEVDRDLRTLEAAFDEAEASGFEPTSVGAECAFGWLPHHRESSWETGTLFEWRAPEGGPDARALQVALSGGGSVWIQLDAIG